MMLDRFEKDALRLLKAGWKTGRVRDWAISAASGYGSLWQSPKHALIAVNDLCKAENARIRAANARMRSATAFDKIERDPLAFLIEAVGGKSRPDPKRGRRS